MAEIIAFNPSAARLGRAPLAGVRSTGELVFFTGVRYERNIPDLDVQKSLVAPAAGPVKTPPRVKSKA